MQKQPESLIGWSYPTWPVLPILYKFIYLCIFGCVGSLLLRAGFLQLWRAGGYSSLWCAGFSLRWLLLLRSTGSRHAVFSSCGLWALERRLSNCGTRAQLLRGMWDLPGPGLEPVSPALAGATREVPVPTLSHYHISNNIIAFRGLTVVRKASVTCLR